MNNLMQRYIIAYDIKDDSRRIRVSKLLQSYGNRLQYSVFLMEMREVRLVRMEERLHTLINGAEDSVVIARLDDAKTSESNVFIGSRNYEDVRVPTVI